jgi:TonB family protein
MKHLARLFVALSLVVPAAVLAQQSDSTVYKPGDGVSLPSVVKQVNPDYTPEAKSQRIEGRVGLDCVVRADGAVSDIKVTRSLDPVYGLDRKAVEAMGQWQFKPGMKDGKAVAVQIAVEMNFTLK